MRKKTRTGTAFLFHFHGCRGPVTMKEGVQPSKIVKAFEDAGMPVVNSNHNVFPDGTVSVQPNFGKLHKIASIMTFLETRHVMGSIYLMNEEKKNGHRVRKALENLKEYFEPRKAKVDEHPFAMKRKKK